MALFDLLGRQWAMGVLWILSENGPCTFRRLQKHCETISPAALNTRLKELQAAGFINRVDAGYALTELGLRLYRHLVPLGDFGKAWAKYLDALDTEPDI
ncbi:transcriptional regulator, HxlR family [Pseudooceanicola antarcticus]|nr:helix-turn-helix domain-containing protein [Pseudooceanicola antarcticus]SNY47964.1 transcriptional regulator, HxlR family [Pseudooceanicola antarcticus]